MMYIYMMTNYHNTVIYIGVTNDLVRRVWQHKKENQDGFTKRYHVTKLVYYEQCADPYAAITREKQWKSGSRQRKIALIEEHNPGWIDLYESLLG